MKHFLRFVAGISCVALLWTAGGCAASRSGADLGCAHAHETQVLTQRGQAVDGPRVQTHGDHHQSGVIHQSLAMPKLVLNEGRKWRVDDHTRRTFSKMQSEFSVAGRSSAQSLRATGQQLNVRIQELIKGCTLVGPAHNQLHLFLEKFMPAVDSLTHATERSVGESRASEIEKMLASYNDYFE